MGRGLASSRNSPSGSTPPEIRVPGGRLTLADPFDREAFAGHEVFEWKGANGQK
jgi:hypothetical protein